MIVYIGRGGCPTDTLQSHYSVGFLGVVHGASEFLLICHDNATAHTDLPLRQPTPFARAHKGAPLAGDR